MVVRRSFRSRNRGVVEVVGDGVTHSPSATVPASVVGVHVRRAITAAPAREPVPRGAIYRLPDRRRLRGIRSGDARYVQPPAGYSDAGSGAAAVRRRSAIARTRRAGAPSDCRLRRRRASIAQVAIHEGAGQRSRRRATTRASVCVEPGLRVGRRLEPPPRPSRGYQHRAGRRARAEALSGVCRAAACAPAFTRATFRRFLSPPVEGASSIGRQRHERRRPRLSDAGDELVKSTSTPTIWRTRTRAVGPARGWPKAPPCWSIAVTEQEAAVVAVSANWGFCSAPDIRRWRRWTKPRSIGPASRRRTARTCFSGTRREQALPVVLEHAKKADLVKVAVRSATAS